MTARIFVLARLHGFGFAVLFEMSLDFLSGDTSLGAAVGTWHGEELALNVVGLKGVCSEATPTIAAVHEAFRTRVHLEGKKEEG